MADVNKVILIGRLTRDPEMRTFSNGGKVAKFGFAVGSRRKNPQTGQWEDGDTMFIDCDAFNRGDYGHMADRVERFLKKGTQVYLEGRLQLEQWDDKTTGQKRSKHKMVVDNLQLLDPKQDGEGGMTRDGGYSRGPATAARQAPTSYYPSDADDEPASSGEKASGDDDIPF